jgi:poly(hydroxyalkanoate) depolymerase family esterase
MPEHMVMRSRLRGRDRLAPLLAIGLGVLVTAAAFLPGTASAAATGTLTSGTYAGPNGARDYELYVPSSYDPSKPMPLVVAMHGCTQTADGFQQLTGWDAEAEAKGFIVLYPQQDSAANYLSCWNFFQDADMHRAAGEPMSVAALTGAVENTYSIDPHRIYASGLSAGGAMASVMGATYPDVFAAIGIGSGCEYAATATCAGYKSADPVAAASAAYKEMGSYARPMPFIAFEGDADTTVPPVNADQLVQQWLLTDDLADDGLANGSVSSNPASTTSGVSPGGQSYTVKHYNDKSKAELAQYWTVHGMNHAWSGGSPSQQYSDPAGPNETDAMWTFFASHPAPGNTGAINPGGDDTLTSGNTTTGGDTGGGTTGGGTTGGGNTGSTGTTGTGVTGTGTTGTGTTGGGTTGAASTRPALAHSAMPSVGAATLSASGTVTFTLTAPSLPKGNTLGEQLALGIFAIGTGGQPAKAKSVGTAHKSVKLHSKQKLTVRIKLSAKLRSYLKHHPTAAVTLQLSSSQPGHARTVTTTVLQLKHKG